MKYLIVLAACVFGVFAQTPSQKLENTLNGLKEQMPCGFPDLGVPPLAPLKGDFFDLYSKLFILKIYGSISDFTVSGLDNYEVSNVNLNVLTLKLGAELNFKNIRAKGNYYLESFVIGLLKLKGEGTFDISLADFSVKLYARVGMVEGLLRVMDMEIDLAMKDMKSKLTGIIGPLSSLIASSLFDKTILAFMRDSQELLSENIVDIVLPQADGYLQTMTISDLLGMLQNPPEPAEPCIPPKYYY